DHPKRTKNKTGKSFRGVGGRVNIRALAYRTTPRSTTGETPFSLVYGMEALLQVELELQSQRSSTYNQEQNEELMLTALDTIKELREQASTRVEAYKQRMRAAHDMKVKIRRFQVGDLVWKRVDVLKHVGKMPGLSLSTRGDCEESLHHQPSDWRSASSQERMTNIFQSFVLKLCLISRTPSFRKVSIFSQPYSTIHLI
ncbi:Unknown protein, partial [Striga hermonthica]